MEKEEDGIQQEGTVIDENTEITDLMDKEEDTSESSAETSKTDDTVTEPETAEESPAPDESQGVKTDIPFHEHPRFKELIEEKNREREARESLEEELNSFKEQARPFFEKKTEVPEWFGGDREAWVKYQAYEQDKINQAEERAIARIKAEQDSESQRITEANSWIDSNIADLEATGAKVDRNKLLKTTFDYQLVDTQGRWNIKAAAEILKAQTKVDTSDKKKLASSTTETIKSDKPKDYLTPKELRNKGWYDFNN